MSVLVVITDPADAAALTRWGLRFACCEEKNLDVLVALQGSSPEPPATVSLTEIQPGDDSILDPIREALGRVEAGASFRPEVVVKRGAFLHRLRTIEKEIADAQTTLLLVGKRASGRVNRADGNLARRLFHADRIALFESLQVSSRWNFDFFGLISLSTAIAALGLIQNSAAVVIGAMLVAPLMAPLLGSVLVSKLSNKGTMAVPPPLVEALQAEIKKWESADWTGATVRLAEGRVVLDVDLTSGSILGRGQAEELAGIVREYWHEPVLVRLHPAYIVEGELGMEAGFAPRSTP